ncbi:MAG: response regulator [Myxococcota bacterium]|jgi:CheY-like chemotaxis protein|nr:response regulator [Myxococcota bacterium]
MGPRILIVDDADEHRRALLETLGRAGYQAEGLATGPAALASLKRGLPDLLIVDPMLPGLSGFEVLAAARQLAPAAKLPLVAITDLLDTPHCREELRQRYTLLGVLAKPVPAEELLALLQLPAGARWTAAPVAPAASAPSPPEESTQPNLVPPQPVDSGGRPAAPRRPEPFRVLTPLATVSARGTPLAIPEHGVASPEAPHPPATGLAPAAVCPPPAAWPPELERGELLETPFARLLWELQRCRASGQLFLRLERKKKVIDLVQGTPWQVKSNLLQECLGRILVREGMISEADLEESVTRMKARQQLQGQVLLEMGSISERNLRYGLARQIESKLLEIFTWSGGSFRFQPLPGPEHAGDPALAARLGDLLHEGVLRFCPSEVVRAELNRRRAQRPVRRAAPAFPPPPRLTAAEEAFYYRLDGVRTVAETVGEGVLPEEVAGRLLLLLLYTDGIQLVA